MTQSQDATRRRTGDAIAIPGNYQYRALREGFVVQRFWHQLKLTTIARVMPPTEDMVALDLGCGSGVVADYLAAQARRVDALDSNPSAIEFAQSAFQRPNLHFQLGQAEDLRHTPETYDAIYCLEMIEHLYWEQVGALFEIIARALRPGGKLFITAPNYHSLWPVVEFGLDRLGLAAEMDGHQHVWRPTRARLRQLGSPAGLELVGLHRGFGLAPFCSVLGWGVAERIERLEHALGCPLGMLLIGIWRKG